MLRSGLDTTGAGPNLHLAFLLNLSYPVSMTDTATLSPFASELGYDDEPTTRGYCPTCRATTDQIHRDSANFGNVVADCLDCDAQFAVTPVDHAAIRREARRGF